jgi:hypothetical protein
MTVTYAPRVGEWDEANDLLQSVRRSVDDLAGEDFRTEIHQLLLARVIVELAGVRTALAANETLDQIAAQLGDDEGDTVREVLGGIWIRLGDLESSVADIESMIRNELQGAPPSF